MKTLSNKPLSHHGSGILEDQRIFLQILAVVLTLSPLAYSIISPILHNISFLLPPINVLISLAILFVAFYLIRKKYLSLAIHFIFIPNLIFLTLSLFSSGAPFFAYFMLITLVAMIFLDKISAAIIYGIVILLAVSFIVFATNQMEASFLPGYYLTSVSLGLISWSARTISKNTLQLSRLNAASHEHANEVLTTARQNAELATEAQARAAQLSTLNRISMLLSLSPTLADVFDGARREIFSLIEATGLSIMLLTPEKTHINWIYGFEKGKEVDLSHIAPLPISQGFSGHVVRTREVLLINHQTQEISAEYKSFTIGAPASSWLGLPLIVANELIGVLAVENEFDHDAFTQQDVDLLKIIAGPLAVAINNHLQFTRIEEALASQSEQRIQLQTAAEVAAAATSILGKQELIERSVSLIKERFNLYYVGLFLADGDGENAILRAGSGDAGRQQVSQGHSLKIGGRSLIGGAMSDGRIRISQDVIADTEWQPNPILPETKAELALPLKVRGRIIGALTVQSNQRNFFKDSLIGTLQTMADQLAIAIENAQLLENAEARARQQRLLNEVSLQMYRSTDVTEIIRTGLKALSEQLEGAPVSVHLGDSTPTLSAPRGEK